MFSFKNDYFFKIILKNVWFSKTSDLKCFTNEKKTENKRKKKITKKEGVPFIGPLSGGP
jgi:hypothetical protein